MKFAQVAEERRRDAVDPTHVVANNIKRRTLEP